VLTHTRPCPPPGAGGLVAVLAVAPLAGAGVAAAGLAAAAEVFGLNKSPRLNLAGDADAAGLAAAAAASPFVRVRFALGEAAGETAGDGDTAGLAAVAASTFLRTRFALGEAAGDAEVAGDVAVWAAEGDSPGVGD
jgi:hypothetical protein